MAVDIVDRVNRVDDVVVGACGLRSAVNVVEKGTPMTTSASSETSTETSTGTTVESSRESTMDAKTRELVAVAASLAAGCEKCLRQHTLAARRAGASATELQQAVEIARAARLTAVLGIDEVAERLTNAPELPVAVAMSATDASDASAEGGCGPDCDCH
jgi:AhpD family alkylhydroperoxidase